MKMKYIFYLAVISISCLSQRGYAQSGVSQQVYQSIDAQIKQIYGSSYGVGITINVDSLIGTGEQITDPYGTLRHCYLFLAGNHQRGFVESRKSFVGIYRDGEIIWHSDTLIDESDEGRGNFYATLDMNHDGKVDIITSWDVGARFAEEYWWIFGWDGHNGVLENAVDNANQSVVAAEAGTFQLEDFNGNGVMEIVGRQDSLQFVEETEDGVTQEVANTIEKRYVVYSWNGQLYGRWPDTPPYPVNGIVPRNKVDVDVHASVTRANTGLDYRYIIHSKRTSRQDIDQMMLLPVSDSLHNVSTRSGWGFNPGGGNLLWQAGSFIEPGETDSSFVYRTKALPTISNYYVRGHNGPPMGPGGPAWYQDVLTNSAHGLTIGAGDLPSPFVPLDFLDTLISYKDQCVTLGWLRNDRSREQECGQTMRSKDWYVKEEVGKIGRWGVNDSWDFDRDWNGGLVGILDKRLDMAKRMLTRGDSVQARRDLQIFVMEVELVYRLGEKSRPNYLYDGMPPKAAQEARSKKSDIRGQKAVMSSEAYALLKYNAEYLIDRLPERH